MNFSECNNSPHEYVREYIPKLADEIRQKITNGCTVYGEHIDVNDDDSALVAAYYLGMCDPSVELGLPLKMHERPTPRPLYHARHYGTSELWFAVSVALLLSPAIALVVWGIFESVP